MADELTCILFALPREVMFFRRTLRDARRVREAPCPAWLGRSEHGPVLVLICGMGSRATERALGWLLREQNPVGRPDLVISAGFCGALAPGLEVGALIEPAEIVDSEGCGCPIPAGIGRGGRGSCRAEPGTKGKDQAWEGEAPAEPGARSKREGEPPGEPGDRGSAGASPSRYGERLVTVSAPVLSPAARQALHQRCGAVAVDMESLTAAQFCRDAGVPFACLRAVSDDAATLLAPALSAALQGERVSLPRLARAVLRQPWLILELRKLAQQSRRAAHRLADGLQRLLGREINRP